MFANDLSDSPGLLATDIIYEFCRSLKTSQPDIMLLVRFDNYYGPTTCLGRASDKIGRNARTVYAWQLVGRIGSLHVA
jgi:hypothetical protein